MAQNTVAEVLAWKNKQSALSGLLQKADARLEILQEQQNKILEELKALNVTPETIDAHKADLDKEITALTEKISAALVDIEQTLIGTGLELPPDLKVLINEKSITNS